MKYEASLRSHDRGPIEALQSVMLYSIASNALCGHMTAAPLKRIINDHPQMDGIALCGHMTAAPLKLRRES